MVVGLTAYPWRKPVPKQANPLPKPPSPMARISPHSLLADISGTIGKEVVFKRYKDKTVVSKYPDMTKVKPSARQKQERSFFREATAFAQLINRHPQLRALYAAELLPGETVFHRVKKEYLNRFKE